MTLRVPGYSWIGSNVTSGNSYVSGYPASILLHMTVSTGLSSSYAQNHPYPPQCWANVYTGDKWQSLELDRAGLALYQPSWTNSYLNRKWYCIQTELVGYPEVNVETYSHEQCQWIGAHVIAPQVQALRSVGLDVNLSHVKYHTDSSGSASEYWPGRMSDAEWASWDGVCAHIDAVGNDHWDCSVERIDLMVQAAVAALGGGYVPTVPPTTGGGGGGGGSNPGTAAVGGWAGVYLSNYTEHASVGTWQSGMNNMHGAGLDVDNMYGNMSESACISLQRSVGLDPDGVVGPLTWDATFSGAVVIGPPSTGSGGGGGAPPWPGTYLENYTSGGGTAQWQQQMANRGWNISVDDEYGGESERVCTQFQQDKGLDVDGVVGPQTWAAAWTAPIT